MNERPKLFRNNRGGAGKTFNANKKSDDLYDTQWESYRKSFLNWNKLCYVCAQPATVVDHLTPHKGDVKLFWKEDNYIPLCANCHNRATALFDRRYRKGEPIDRKLRWLADSRVRLGLTGRVKVVPFSRELWRYVGEKMDDR